MQYAVLIVGFCNIVRAFEDHRLGICHGNTESGSLDHSEIIVTVAAADHLLGGKSDTGEELKKRMRLVDTRGHDLKEERV